MKAISAALLFFLVVAPSLPAQQRMPNGGTPSDGSLSSAWFITVGGGFSAHDNGPFSRRLRSYTPLDASEQSMLYQTEHFSSIGTNLIAGGGVLFDYSYVVGVSGERVSFPVVRAITSPGQPRDEYALTGGGAGVDLGYAIVNTDATIIYPYLHAGLYGFELAYKNNQVDSIPFFEGNPVPPGSSATYDGSAFRLGAGISMMKFVGGGLLVGARIAYGHMLSRPSWEDNGTPVNNGGLTPCYNSLTIGLTIGGGGGL